MRQKFCTRDDWSLWWHCCMLAAEMHPVYIRIGSFTHQMSFHIRCLFISDVFSYQMSFHIRWLFNSYQMFLHAQCASSWGLFTYQVYLRIRCLFIIDVFKYQLCILLRDYLHEMYLRIWCLFMSDVFTFELMQRIEVLRIIM